jgi:hypothetical protein
MPARAPQVPTITSVSTNGLPSRQPPMENSVGPPSQPAITRSGTTWASAPMVASNTR